MTIKMTREQYQAKYGQPPPIPSVTPKPIIRMTQAEYDAKYKTPATQPQQSLGTKILTGEKELFKNALIGGAKGVASTVSGMSGLGQKILQGTVGKALGQKPQPIATLPSKYTEPSNNIQAGAKMGEQVAEFFVPAGKIAKLEKGRNMLTKAAIEGTSAAGIIALQEGKVDKGTLNTGLAVGGLSFVGSTVNKIAQKIPKTAWSQILKQSPVETIKKPKLTEQASKLGLTGVSRESLQKQAQQNIQSLEMSLDDILTPKNGIQPYQKQFQTVSKDVAWAGGKNNILTDSYSKVKATGGNISTKKVVGYLNDLKTSYSIIPGEQSAVDSIDKVAKDLLRKPTLTPLEANQLKQTIYRHIKNTYGKGLLEIPPTAQAQKQIARGLKNEIEKIIPEAKTITEKQAIYIQLDKQLEKAISRTQGKGVMGTGIGLYDLIIGGAGQISGYGLVPLVAKKTAESTAVLSGISRLINYFNSISPTKKILFYNAIKGLVAENMKSKK